jgi:predicted nucleotidyltransferase
MNEASLWRLAMARRMAPIYATDPKVRAVIVGGSVARGCADRYSDVEMGIFWDEPPSAAELCAAMERLRGTEWELDPYNADEDVWYEEYGVDGLKLDLRHMTVARMGEVLAAVVDGGDLSEERQQIIAAVQDGVALHGTLLIEKWQARATVYPGSLARAMVRKYLSLPPWWSVPMLAERGDLPLVYGAFKEATGGIFGGLLGLNRIYHPGLKWIDRTLAALQLAPPDLVARLKQVFRVEPLAGARQMQQLVEETYTLVEQQMPDAGITEARQAFRYCRPILDAAPSGWS